MDAILKKIAKLRVKRGITQREIAGLLHVTVPTYSKMEIGILQMALPRLLLVAQILEVDCAALLDQEDPEKDPAALEMEILREELVRFHHLIIVEQGKLIDLYERKRGF